MVKQEDIFKALQEGVDAQTMAQQFADALNAAIAQKNALDAKKNAEVQEKMAHMNAIIEDVFDFMDKYYPEFQLPKEAREQITAEAVIDAMDQAAEEAKELSKLFKALEARHQKTGNIQPAVTPVQREVNPDSIANFLKAQGLA